jgi:hypothetical protein
MAPSCNRKEREREKQSVNPMEKFRFLSMYRHK